jgi:ankyrin repeat protein
MKTTLPLLLALLLLGGCGAPEKPTVTLYLAMQRGDIEQIERHIKWGSDMNRLNRDGYAPLHMAVMNGRTAIVRLLLKNGVEVNRPDKDGHTPLWHAVLGGHTIIADLLLKAGAKMEATAWLLDAARLGVRKRDAIEYLVRHGANLGARNQNGDTPLLIAIRQGNHKLAKHLVNGGADVTVRDASGKTALEIANSLGLRDIALLLKRNGAT